MFIVIATLGCGQGGGVVTRELAMTEFRATAYRPYEEATA
jgi:hypothetical protein